ncbi:MAG: energy transducer TonB [Terriglobales bacterium]
MKSVPLLVAVFCVATAGSLLSQALDGQSPVAPRPDGFVFCSDHDNGQPVPLYGRCRKRQIGSLKCGEKVTVDARSDDMLRVLLAGGFPRYVALSAISRQPDKFVSFDNDAEVPNLGPIDCSLPPRQPLVDGFMVCSDRQDSAPVYFSPCHSSPSGSLACGEKVGVRARRGDMIQISLPSNGMPRYALASSVSQKPDKFVAFDDDSGVPEMSAPACALEPEHNVTMPPASGSGGNVMPGRGHEPDRNVTMPRAIFAPNPEYTEQARKKKINGTVLLSLTVTVDGTTRDIKLVKGVGYGLDEKAVEAVSRWKFTPALKDGQPIEKEISVEVDFHLY